MKYSNVPNVGLIYALRHSSHRPHTAIADLLDNSIDADADKINIEVRQVTDHDNTVSQLVIGDNGVGMDEPTLVKALTMGDHSDAQNGSSLGKFGLGLKTSATTLGLYFTILTKVDGGKLLKCVYDPQVFAKTKKWEIEIDETTNSEDVELFEKHCDDDGSGTVIIINDLSRNWALGSIYNGMNTVKRHISQAFFKFLTPHVKDRKPEDEVVHTGKVRILIQGEDVYGIDPLERHLSNTEYLYGSDGGTISTTKGTFTLKAVHISEEDYDLCNLTPNPSNQGFYVYRNNREIMSAETTLFDSIWKQKHPTGNYLRVELCYSSDMDEIFQVNHDKCGLKNIDQSVYDRIQSEIGSIITAAKRAQGIRNRKKNSVNNEAMTKAFSSVLQSILNKKNVLDLPNDRKQKRKLARIKKGTITPKNTTRKKSGGNTEKNTVNTRIGKFVLDVRDMGIAGPVYDIEFVDGIFAVYWNLAHPFVGKYITTDDESNSNYEQIQSLSLMLFSTATYLQQIVDEKGDEGWLLRDNFIESMSKNLRALAS